MKKFLIAALFSTTVLSALFLNFSCQSSPSGPNFTDALETIVPGTTAVTAVPTFTPTPTPTTTYTPTPTPT